MADYPYTVTNPSGRSSCRRRKAADILGWLS